MNPTFGGQMQKVYDAMDRLAYVRKVAGRPPLVYCSPPGNAELGRKLVGPITRPEARRRLAARQAQFPNTGVEGRAWRRCWPEETES